MSNHDNNGRFVSGNKAAKGRKLGSLNKFTQLMMKGYSEQIERGERKNPIELMADLSEDTEVSADIKLRATSKLSDVLLKAAETEEQEEKPRTIEEVEQRILELLAICSPQLESDADGVVRFR